MHRTPTPSDLLAKPRMATQKQLNFIRNLMEQRDLAHLSEEQRMSLNQPDEFWSEETTRLTRDKASRIIDALLELPKTDVTNGDLPQVPDGRYAVPKDDGTLMFYSVKKGNYTIFVDVWASDARWPIKAKQEKVRILEAIKADPDAGPRFGREIGRCYVCGRTLTDELSRSLGIGPVCRDQ